MRERGAGHMAGEIHMTALRLSACLSLSLFLTLRQVKGPGTIPASAESKSRREEKVISLGS